MENSSVITDQVWVNECKRLDYLEYEDSIAKKRTGRGKAAL